MGDQDGKQRKGKRDSLGDKPPVFEQRCSLLNCPGGCSGNDSKQEEQEVCQRDPEIGSEMF